MRSANGLTLVAVLSLGVLLGIHAKGGSVVSETSAVTRSEGLSSADRPQLPEKPDVTAGGVRPGEHLVRIPFPIFPNEDVQAVGVWGTCVDEKGNDTVPSGECVFTVEAVQYHRDPDSGATKFNVVCVDLSEYPNFSADVPSCSPMERGSIEIGVGPSFAVNVGGGGGVAAGLFGEAKAGVDAGLGFSVPIPIHRKFRYPIQRPKFGGRMGGNVLVESGVGSITAGRSVIFGHSNFDGSVVFFITKPLGMSLLFGSFGRQGAVCFDGGGGPADCPSDQPGSFTAALHHVCGIGNVGGCGESVAGVAPLAPAGAAESDFDLQEVKDALDDESQAIQDLIDELKARIEAKIAEVFDALQGYLGPAENNTAAVQRSEAVDKMMSLLRERISAHLQEIRDIARETVTCPQ